MNIKAIVKNILSNSKDNLNKLKGDDLYIAKCVKKSKSSKEELEEQYESARKIFGISSRDFYRLRLYDRTEARIARIILNNNRKIEAEKLLYIKISKLCGKTKKEIKAEINAIKEEFNYSGLNLQEYYQDGLYNYTLNSNYSEISELVNICLEKEKYKGMFRAGMHSIDSGIGDYSELENIYSGYIDLLKKTVTEKYIESICDKLKFIKKNINEGITLTECAYDALAAKELIGFSIIEYRMFMLCNCTLSEKREFITSSERTKVIASASSREIRDLLDDKFEAYKMLKDFYGREIVKLEGDHSKDVFLNFCSKHPVFVKKNSYDSLGRGVMKIDSRDWESLDELYDSLNEDLGNITLEELIVPHEKIKYINPDSVNSVRVMVCQYNDDEPEILGTIMRIGRKGSFVDNGGAGGIFVHVDEETGVLDTEGIDERGIRYAKHPDHGYDIVGYQLPEWDKMIRVAKEAMKAVEGLSFAGWDITYTADNRWIIIEGNSGAQFLVYEGPTHKGLRKKFCDVMHYDIANLTAPKEKA